jgi:hypothetical protein
MLRPNFDFSSVSPVRRARICAEIFTPEILRAGCFAAFIPGRLISRTSNQFIQSNGVIFAWSNP